MENMFAPGLPGTKIVVIVDENLIFLDRSLDGK
jgi:hypothetical protein